MAIGGCVRALPTTGQCKQSNPTEYIQCERRVRTVSSLSSRKIVQMKDLDLNQRSSPNGQSGVSKRLFSSSQKHKKKNVQEHQKSHCVKNLTELYKDRVSRPLARVHEQPARGGNLEKHQCVLTQHPGSEELLSIAND